MRAPRSFLAAIATVVVASAVALSGTAALAADPVVDLGKGSAYLVNPANLIDGRYYESFPGFPEFGITIDGAYALAAAGGHDHELRAIAEFIRTGGVVGESGFTVTDWMGIGTDFPSGGAIGKVAVLAEATGYDPRTFTGHDLISALHDLTCAAADDSIGCAGKGNYRNATSVFSQALGIIAQIRAGQAADAQDPVAYLLSLQRSDGAFPSLIPAADTDKEVDSTAMAAMALDLVSGDADVSAAVDKALVWLAGKQDADHGNGFPGAAGISTNSTALAIQGLSLRASAYAGKIGLAQGFLAARQNADGGFDVAVDADGSDLRASVQVVGGSTGISFGTMLRDVHVPPASPSASASPRPTTSNSAGPSASATASPSAPGGLPITGYSLPWLIGIAMALLGAGLALVVIARRRGLPAGGPR